jgi:menaquinol-cytochrome c reductase iron-sulfur subunit
VINEERRSFLGWAVNGLGAVFAAVLGVPALAYLGDGRNRAAPNRGFRTVSGIKLDDTLQEGKPVQGVIRDVRRDAWNVSQDVVGRVWVVKLPGGDIKVFTTICPHLGCSINLDSPPQGFTCPCHGGKFQLDGSLDMNVANNPAPRGMDTLEWRRDSKDPTLLEVKYQNFRQAEHEKIVKA